tara:strand:- start:240 stop:1745 length:1506 start_codon:yes stop_codon:yes gene_type:complete
MEGSEKKEQGKRKVTEIKTYTVPFSLGENQGNLTINTNQPSKSSKEQVINQALKCHSQGKIQEAAKLYQYCINQGFNDYTVFANYGVILQNFGKSQEAELVTRKAIEIKPDLAATHLNLGLILKKIDKLKEAELSQRKAIELNPNYAEAHYNLGTILIDCGKLKEAELSLGKAIELNPDYYDAYFNLSWLQLLRGEYQAGLENYEFRFKTKNPVIPHSKTKLKRVDNKKLKGQEKLLIISEQGLGDTLQYMRYIPYLRSLGIDVSFCAQTKLHSLIQSSRIDCHPLTSEEASKISEGYWIPLLSLSRYLQINPRNPIVSEPYINSRDGLVKKWEKILSKEKKPIIGINWQGNPDVENENQKGRSLPLEIFSNLDRDDNFKFLSLQKGFGSEQLDYCSFKNKFVECQSQINSTWDFLENAAIIQNCDLIITSDTSIAHLAGGMGKSTWTLLKHLAEWRWGTERESTFWYPSMRLFRQKELHNWNEVMRRVSGAVKKEMKLKI